MSLLVLPASMRGPVEPPAWVLDALRAFHPGLTLAHHPLDRRQWSLMLAWREDDPRHGLRRSGEIGDYPFDVVGWLPADIRLDDVPGYVERHLTTVDREDVRRAVRAMQAKNAAQTDAAIAKPFEQVEEIVAHVGAAAMVTGDLSRKKARSRGATFKPAA